MLLFVFVHYVSSTNCIDESVEIGRSNYPMDSSIYIDNCFFRRNSVYSNTGGILYIYSSPISLTISNSMFYYCKTSSFHGGAISMDSSLSEKCNIRYICANLCESAKNGQFAFVRLSPGKTNHVEFSSLSKCSDSCVGDCPIWLYYGNQRFSESNSSMNHNTRDSGMAIDYATTFESGYSTFANNYASIEVCLYLYNTTGTIKTTNIVHNNSPTNLGVVYIANNAIYSLEDCIILGNSNTLFHVSSGSITIQRSFIQHSSIISSGNVIITQNYTMAIPKTHVLKQFGTFYCNADYIVSFTTNRKASPLIVAVFHLIYN